MSGEPARSVQGNAVGVVARILAPNPGPFTGPGTNTWLVGREALAVIDPGPDDERHLDAMLAEAGGRPITHIVVTHAHRDHVDAVARLKRMTGAIVLGCPRGADDPSRSANPNNSPSGGDFVAWDVPFDHALSDGEKFEAGDQRLEAIHTPGHAPDHLCFALLGSDVIFSGDHVMGWSTSVIAPPEGRMGDYLASLERLVARPETRYLPGHGDGIADGPRTARAYLLHRQMREQAIIDAIMAGDRTAREIAERVYAGLDPAIWNAAVLSVQAHLEYLNERDRVNYALPLTSERPLTLSL